MSQLPAIGELFKGKYEIREVLGRGGFATVFRATDVDIGRDVAIKVLTPRDETNQARVVARFMVEARVIAGLQDSHTIRLFEFGESESGLLYMVFQFVHGDDLAAVLARDGALPPAVVVHVTRQVLHALAEAHAAAVLHRDIKPGNILVHEYMGDAYSVKLLDFGIAKVDANGSGGAGLGLTRTGVVLGTPRYMAPEQIFGEPLTAASDIYSLGLVAYEMLVGDPAVNGSREEILTQQVSDEPHRLPPNVGWPALRMVIEQMAARDPRSRYPSARAALQALDQALEQHERTKPTTPQHRSAPLEHAPTPADSRPHPARAPSTQVEVQARSPWRAVGIGALVCCVFGIAALMLIPSHRGPGGPAPTPRLPDELLKVTPAPTHVERAEIDVAIPDAGDDAPDAGVQESDAGAHGSGCGRPEERHGDRRLDLGYKGRTARVFLPRGYDPNHRYPIILAFPPRYFSPAKYISHSGLRGLTERADVIVVGVDPTNTFNPWHEPDEVEVARRTIWRTYETYCVDRSHVFAMGHHDGGGMARDVSCTVPLSGLATTGHAELSTRSWCDPTPPVPMMWILGTEDDFLPIEGGRGCTTGPFLSARQEDQLWKSRNGCRGEASQWSKTKTSQCKTWACHRAPYVSCRADGGHFLRETEWSLMFPSCSNRKLKFDVANEVWAFFQKQGRQLRPDETQ